MNRIVWCPDVIVNVIVSSKLTEFIMITHQHHGAILPKAITIILQHNEVLQLLKSWLIGWSTAGCRHRCVIWKKLAMIMRWPSQTNTCFCLGSLHSATNTKVLPSHCTTIHQLTTMLSTAKNVLFSGHNHLLATGADDPHFNYPKCLVISIGRLQVVMTWKKVIFRGCEHGGYLVDSGFLRSVLLWPSCSVIG